MMIGNNAMATISTKEIAADLAGVLDRVARGEEFTVFNGDQPVARIVPVEVPHKNGGIDRDAAIDRLKTFGQGRFLGDIDIRELIEAGRM